jgi:acyl-CoA synthetase (AMP-forming)/AMP-acid ligase II
MCPLGTAQLRMAPQPWRPTELIALLRHAGERALVTHARFADKVEGLTDEAETLEHIVGVGGAMRGAWDYETLLQKAVDAPLAAGDADDLAALNFSGGTTGAPKATTLRHRTLMTVAANTIPGFDIRPDAVFLNVRPLWPIAQVILMSYVMAGATVVLGRKFDPDDLASGACRSPASSAAISPSSRATGRPAYARSTTSAPSRR